LGRVALRLQPLPCARPRRCPAVTPQTKGRMRAPALAACKPQYRQLRHTTSGLHHDVGSTGGRRR
jgi:hypothetical protein